MKYRMRVISKWYDPKKPAGGLFNPCPEWLPIPATKVAENAGHDPCEDRHLEGAYL